MHEWPDFWWTSITGPRNLCDAVAQALQNESNVCLLVPDDLPWRDQMRGCIEYDMHRMPDMDSFCVEYIDVEDECPHTDDIGFYLLERFAEPAVAAGFRGRETMQKYILDNQVLKNRILWIKGMNPEQERKWIHFCKGFTPCKDSDGRFVLEVRWIKKESKRRNFVIVQYGEMINQYDLTLFNSAYLNNEKNSYSSIWQQYSAVLCALLCNTDAEISRALMEKCAFISEEPLIWVYKVAEEAMYSRRGENNDRHVLSLARNNNLPEMYKRIWKAQLQVVFPLLEIERVTFIERYREQISEALNSEYCDYRTGRLKRVYQFGEVINNPDDAELGTIYRMMKLKREYDTNQYLLYIPDEKARLRMELLHSIRNALAHGKYCEISDLAEFINSNPFVW